MLKLVLFTAALLALPIAAPAATPAGCAGPERRQLDFWVGEWEVFNTPDNVRYGSSRIETLLDGCGISETYDSPQAPGGHYTGVSYSGFDPVARKWRQLYIDTTGRASLLEGGMEGSDMVLYGTTPKGAKLRMAYSPRPDGAVHQIVTVSTDGGKTWKPGFDYTYRRK